MKKILLMFFMVCSASLIAQDMKTLYINMPDSLSPMLTKVNREDFADFLESNMKAQVKNKFDDNSEMTQLNSTYLYLKMSGSSAIQMKLLPLNDTEKVICVVHTFNGPASDSSIRFYSTDWNELPKENFLSLPETDQFFLKNDTINQEEEMIARKRADMNLIRADLSPTENTLSFTYTTIDYMDKESAEELKPFLKSAPLVYEWSEDQKFIFRQ